MSEPKKWTKRELKAIRSAVISIVLANSTVDGRGRGDVLERLKVHPKRLEGLVIAIRNNSGIGERSAQRDREFIAHLKAHPEIYGKEPTTTHWDSQLRRHVTRDESVANQIARCEAQIRDVEKGIAWNERLITRLQNEELPEGTFEGPL